MWMASLSPCCPPNTPMPPQPGNMLHLECGNMAAKSHKPPYPRDCIDMESDATPSSKSMGKAGTVKSYRRTKLNQLHTSM